MTIATLPAVLNADIQVGKPPILHAEAGGHARGWATEHRDSLHALVAEHGSILVRGLNLDDGNEASEVFQSLTNELMAEKEAIESRRVYGNGVYHSSKWASNQPMCSHHELSYVSEFPRLMMFACLNDPISGGATGVADSSAVLEALPPGLVYRFEREGWLLTRNYNEEMGSSIAESFGTDNRDAVEAYCNANAIEFEWQPDGALHTRQRRSAIVHHPVSGQRCWFNQIAFLNEWTLDPEVREYLVEVYGAHGLPFNTHFGNGESIGEDIIQMINEVYEAHVVREPLQAGDLILIDNIRSAHSRDVFEGPREVIVALADPVQLSDCAPTFDVLA